MYITNLRNLKQLECLGYNLQCTERPMAMIYESFRKYSMYYILLFREIESMYFCKNLVKFSSEKTSITNKKIFVNKNNIEEYLRFNFSNNKKMIFFSDHFLNHKYSSYYKTKHYKHPILLKAFDDAKNELTIIDEDIEFISANNNKYFLWPYTEQKIEFNFFEEICGKWNSNQYHVMEFESMDTSEICLSVLINDYQKILNVINSKILSSEDNFLEVFMSNMLDNNTGFITDLGIKYLYNHNKAINRQFRLFLRLFENYTKITKQINKLGNNIKQLYENYYFVVLKNVECGKKDIMNDLLKKIYIVEKDFYNFLENVVSDKTLIESLLKEYADL